MAELIVGITLFATAAISANILQTLFRFRYESKPLVFLALFIGCLAISGMFSSEILRLLFSPYVWIAGGVYLIAIHCLVSYWKPMQRLFGANTVPGAYSGILHPKPIGQVVKVFEIVLQDIAAWLIVGGLLSSINTLFETTVIFTITVAILHIPGIWIFGKVYGGYFFITATLLAFLVPLFYQLGPSGFLFLLILHFIGYIFMYLIMGNMGRKVAKMN